MCIYMCVCDTWLSKQKNNRTFTMRIPSPVLLLLSSMMMMPLPLGAGALCVKHWVPPRYECTAAGVANEPVLSVGTGSPPTLL